VASRAPSYDDKHYRPFPWASAGAPRTLNIMEQAEQPISTVVNAEGWSAPAASRLLHSLSSTTNSPKTSTLA
jgi:hypothetical protein